MPASRTTLQVSSEESAVMQLPRAVVLDPSDNGPGLVRALRRRGVPVTVLAGPYYPWNACGRGIDGRVLSSSPAGVENWLEVLQEIAAAGPGVLIPASDSASEFVARERA